VRKVGLRPYEEWLDSRSKVGVGMDERKGDGDGDSPQTDKERTRRQKSQRPCRLRASSNEPATDVITWHQMGPRGEVAGHVPRGLEELILNRSSVPSTLIPDSHGTKPSGRLE
jgi:hypothetical protein